MKDINEVTKKIVKLNCKDFMTDGLEFVVQSETETHYIGAPNYHIPKVACVVVSPSVEETEGEVKGWCIKANNSNIDQLSEWVKFKDGVCSLKVGNWVLSEPCERMVFPMHETTGGSTFNEGFTKLHKVEDFFAKVGYTPEPKLIAKAGEWVKIVDFGDTEWQGTKGAWELNRPYQLKVDLDQKGSFLVVADSRGKFNGWDNVWVNNMKIEPCPAPSPLREPIGTYEGVDIFEDTKAWFINLNQLKIKEVKVHKHNAESINISWVEGYVETCSKVYLTPEAVNARLKKEVIKTAMQRGLTWDQLGEWHIQNTGISILNYAIELVEKDFNVIYLNTESK